MQTVLVGQANIVSLPVVAKATGAAITSGTVNFYVIDEDGTNAGKWYRGSDDSWQAAESVAGVATHRADGHWYLSLPSALWVYNVRYRLYAKESGDLHIPVGEDLLCRDIAAAVWGYVVEGAHTCKDFMRLIASILFGKVTGGGTANPKYRDMADSKNRIEGTVDANGNRTTVTKDAT